MSYRRKEQLRVLDLFSGIGGFSLGLERTGGFRTVAFCEIEPYCRAVLKKHWPDVPCFEDVRKLTAADVGPIDVICGGYPCQPFSTAGKRMGAEDDRHLWPEYFRLVREIRPAWVFAENVAGHVTMGLDSVLSDLEGEGYSGGSFVIPACAVDAKHRRDRLWILAHSNKGRCGEQNIRCEQSRRAEIVCTSEIVAYTAGIGCGQMEQSIKGREGGEGAGGAFEHGSLSAWWCRWLPEPDVGRVANGVPSRVDRLRALGNAVIPQIPEIIGRAILEAEGMTCAQT